MYIKKCLIILTLNCGFHSKIKDKMFDRFYRTQSFRFLHFLIIPDEGGLHMGQKQLIDFVQHVSLENVIHDLVAGQLCSIHQELESEFQTGIHLPSSCLSLAFFSAFLRSKSKDINCFLYAVLEQQCLVIGQTCSPILFITSMAQLNRFQFYFLFLMSFLTTVVKM